MTNDLSWATANDCTLATQTARELNPQGIDSVSGGGPYQQIEPCCQTTSGVDGGCED